ncbi:MAG: YHS domain-containing protein [Candidatus Aminicenantes bacterium]|nr:YHS domain-containing protein [Candidatus Aminicenantes bacterium]
MEKINSQWRKGKLNYSINLQRLIVALFLYFLILPAHIFPAGRQHEHLVKDVVCGMQVDIHETKFTSNYKGKVYYFCSERCKKAFDEDPEKYIEGQLSQVKAEYEKNPDDVKVALKYSKALVQNGSFEEAKSLLNRLTNKAISDEDQSEVYFQLGYIATKQGKYDEALSLYSLVIKKDTKAESYSGAVVNTAAIRYQIKDELEPAFQILSKALKEGRIAERHLATAHKLMLMMNYDRKDYYAAKKYLEMMSSEAAKDEHIADSIWVIYLMTNEKDKGEKILKETYERVQDDFFGLYRLASIAYEANLKIDEALNWIDKANKLSKGEKFYVLDTYSKLMWLVGKREEAINLLEKAISLCKNESALVEMKGRLESYKEALKK